MQIEGEGSSLEFSSANSQSLLCAGGPAEEWGQMLAAVHHQHADKSASVWQENRGLRHPTLQDHMCRCGAVYKLEPVQDTAKDHKKVLEKDVIVK